MNLKLLVDTAVLAGEIMLCNGAETYRVEDTMYHILKTSGAESIETLALMTGIMVTLNGPDMEQPITIVKAVNERGMNLNKIEKVNDISRRYCGGDLSLEDTYNSLKNIGGNQYSRTIYNLAIVIIAAGFAMMFGGHVVDVVGAAIVGALTALIITVGEKTKMNVILADIFSSVGIALLAMLLQAFVFPTMDADIVIISSIMLLVPGVTITSAIRDTMQGDYLSGAAKVLEAFLKAGSVALGVGLGLIVYQIMMGRSIL